MKLKNTSPRAIDRLNKDVKLKVQRWLKFRAYCQRAEDIFNKSLEKEKLPYWKQG